jgi:ribosomal protein S7
MFHQNLPHRASREGEKVRATSRVLHGTVRQLHVRLVDQRRRVHRSWRWLTTKLTACDHTQVVVDELDDAVHRSGIAVARGVEQSRYFPSGRMSCLEMHQSCLCG